MWHILLSLAAGIASPAHALIQASETVPWATPGTTGDQPARSFVYWLAGDVGRQRVGGATFFSGVQICPKLVLTSARWLPEVTTVVAGAGRKLGRAPELSSRMTVAPRDRENFTVWYGPTGCPNIGACLENYIQFALEGLGQPRVPEPTITNVARLESHPAFHLGAGAKPALGDAFHDLAALYLTEAFPQGFTIRLAREPYHAEHGRGFTAGFGSGGRYADRVDVAFSGRFGADTHRKFLPDEDDGSLLPRGSARLLRRFGEVPWGDRLVRNKDHRFVRFIEGAYQVHPSAQGRSVRIPMTYSVVSLPDVEPTPIAAEGDGGGPWLVPARGGRGDSFTLYGLRSLHDSGYVMEAAPLEAPVPEHRSHAVGLGVWSAFAPVHEPENREQILRWMQAPDSGCTPAQIETARGG